MKRCKDKACVKWDALDGILHALKSDLTVITGVELTLRQTWAKSCPKEAVEPIIDHLNKLRWRIQDRVQQVNEIITENTEV